jgi:hypothetical protein
VNTDMAIEEIACVVDRIDSFRGVVSLREQFAALMIALAAGTLKVAEPDAVARDIGGAIRKIEALTQVLAATSSAFEVLLDAIEAVRVEETARAAEAAIAAETLQ